MGGVGGSPPPQPTRLVGVGGNWFPPLSEKGGRRDNLSGLGGVEGGGSSHLVVNRGGNWEMGDGTMEEGGRPTLPPRRKWMKMGG